jgi:hypothetical protein
MDIVQDVRGRKIQYINSIQFKGSKKEILLV